MKYKVSGSNRDTGARMSLEFEAESKAAAERKAAQSGMSVHHVVDITDGYTATATAPRVRSSGSGRGGKLFFFLVILAIAAAAWYFLPQIRHTIGR